MQNFKLDLYKRKEINSRAEIPQNVLWTSPVSFYKREKEDREIVIGLLLFFILKIYFFFFFNELMKEQYGDEHQHENWVFYSGQVKYLRFPLKLMFLLPLGVLHMATSPASFPWADVAWSPQLSTHFIREGGETWVMEMREIWGDFFAIRK